MKMILSGLRMIMGESKIVAASGYFDPIHDGHLDYLEKSKEIANEIGGILVVILNNDGQAVLKKGRPFYPSHFTRKRILEAMTKYVDEVFLSIDEDMTVCKSLEYLKPRIFAKGGDRYSGEIPEGEICRRLGIKIIDGLGEKIQSSSELIKRIRSD